MTVDIDHKSLFHAMPVPRFLIEPKEDNSFIVREINARALDYFNRKEKQIVGKSVEEFMNAENSRHFLQSFEVCLRQKMPVAIQAVPSFPGGIRVHGFWINPLIDLTGEVVVLDVMAQPDSSDESMLQRERDDAITLLTSIFDVSEVGIIVTDDNHRIVRVNDSFVRTFGWSREDIIGDDFSVLSAPADDTAFPDGNTLVMKGAERSTGEMRIVRKNGEIANALFTTATLELSQRRHFQVTTIMDITVRKQMEMSLRMAKEQADTANHAKSAFLANMSHELRTPLNAIIGFSEMMMTETFGPLANEKYKEYLGDIHMSANHLLEIINEVLDMSKIEAGRVELEEVSIPVEELVESVIRIVSSRAFSSGIELNSHVEGNLPNLRVDERLVRQILLNLVSNALKFSDQGGAIDIFAHRVEGTGDVELYVKDTGMGIPKEKIKDALEPFGQIHDSAHAASKAQGTGLGLPLAKAMMELHGGSLDLESDTGKGTTVYITFPSHRVED